MELRYGRGVLVAVELGQVEAGLVQHAGNLVRRPVDKDADGDRERSIDTGPQFRQQVGDGARLDVARRLGVEDEAEQIRARLHRDDGIFDVGESANLDFDHRG